MTSTAPLDSIPYVIVDFVFDRGMLSIAVKNIGALPAYDVRVEFSHKIMGMGGTVEISALPLFSQLEFLPGGKEISTHLDRSASYFRSQQPVEVTANVTYNDEEGGNYRKTIHHNLEIYRNILYSR